MGVESQAGSIARKLHMRGTVGYFVGLAVVAFVIMLLYFALKPAAESVAMRVRAAAGRAKASISNTVSGTSPGAASDPRLEGL
jgi:hypothetical protein